MYMMRDGDVLVCSGAARFDISITLLFNSTLPRNLHCFYGSQHKIKYFALITNVTRNYQSINIKCYFDVFDVTRPDVTMTAVNARHTASQHSTFRFIQFYVLTTLNEIV